MVLSLDRCTFTGKVRFETKGEALNVLRKPNKGYTGIGGKKGRKRKKREKRAYECDYCGGWHLTSKEYFKGNDRDKGKP